MNIWFIGQLGIPEYGVRETITGSRIESLATRFSSLGHAVFVTCAKPYIPSFLSDVKGVRLVHTPSFNPDKPGGWLHTWLTAWKVGRHQPDVVHVHGWKSAVFVRLMALLSPETTFVWTIDGLPSTSSWMAHFVAWQATRVFDAVTTPSRQMQYLLLHYYNLRTVYIPDGFSEPALEPIPVKAWNLRKGQYVAFLAGSVEEMEWVAEAYTSIATRKKLAVIGPDRIPARLSKKYPFLVSLGDLRGRSLSSMTSQAAAVLVTASDLSSDILLKVMHAKTPIVTVSNPLYEEIVGTTGSVVQSGDADGLEAILDPIVRSPESYGLMARKSHLRARNHFSWDRIVPEYLAMYRLPRLTTVPLDSARPVAFTLPR